ncbi:MAG: RnfABCDGE type electron transport complex subunit D [Pseudomonadales bacterium]|nr:RnfABCDGE type electron transport complex subunit D [Pseudomonadales bacterium]
MSFSVSLTKLSDLVVQAKTSTHRMMFFVIAALLPGLVTSIYYFGFGIALNVLLSILTCLLLEGLVQKIRDLPLKSLLDGSAVVTGFLIGLCLPPEISAGIVILGSAFAILFGKLLYGGLGQNIFNPAMVGYAALIISFPLAMSTWPALFNTLDGSSGATPLDLIKFRGAQTIDEITMVTRILSDSPWLVINLSYLVGGIALVYFGIARWQGAAAMLLTLTLLYTLFYDSGSSHSLGSPLFHLFSGGTMLAAFFIVTDPVTSPDSKNGLILFGVGVGLLTFLIRSYGAYPDGIAFAVLLMNATVPLINQIRLKQL